MDSQVNDLVILGGDFNTILNINEKIGGTLVLSQVARDFKAWCAMHDLIDILTNNGNFSWNNRRKD